MFFSSKKQNRRMNRGQILDVKVRSTQRKSARFRLAAISIGVSLAVLLGFFGVWHGGNWVVRKVGPENASFAIKELDIQTDGIISLDQLRRWSGVKQDENLLALDLARVKRDLELVPVIQSTTVERILPGTVRIRVSEREPVAQFIIPQQRTGGAPERAIYTLDSAGTVMLPLDPGQTSSPALHTNAAWPVIAGIQANQFRLGRRVEEPRVQAALKLIDAFNRSPMSSVAELKQIDVSWPDILQVTTSQNSEVVFGLGDFDAQLRRWRAIADLGQRAARHVGTLDLSVSNNVPVCWLDASAVPTATPKPAKPSPYKKKHV